MLLRWAHSLLSRKKASTCYIATQANYSASSNFLNVVIHHPEGSRLGMIRYMVRPKCLQNASTIYSIKTYIYIYIYIYKVSQEERTKLQENVPYVKLYRYNLKHLYPKLNGYEDNGQRKVWTSCTSAYCTSTAV